MHGARATSGYGEGGKATWIPEGGINPPSLSPPMLTHLDNGDEAIIFSAPEARYVSMRISLSDLMWIPIVSDLLSALLSPGETRPAPASSSAERLRPSV